MLKKWQNHDKMILKMCIRDRQRIVLPGRTVVQNIIGQAKVLEAKRLEAIIMKLAAKKTLKLLDQLLEKKDLIYEITDLKKSPKNFQFNHCLLYTSRCV